MSKTGMKAGKSPPVVDLCLNGTLPAVPMGLDTTAADRDLIHVAFYDTRSKPNKKGMLRAAALFNSSRVRFHALLSHPSPVPGMHVTELRLPPRARCIHRNLVRLSHGPGPHYLYKPLLHWVLPSNVEKLIVLDTDVVMIRGIDELWAEFDQFGDAMVGIANEQSNLYRRGAIGKNGGVQLLHLGRMRASARYAASLDYYGAGLDKRWIGYLGDQTLYSFMASSHADLFYQLGCEWNRQLSMQFGFGNATVHRCPRRCGLLHANFGILKCVAAHMQSSPSCDTWHQLMNGTATGRDCPKSNKGRFQKAAHRFFADCCRP